MWQPQVAHGWTCLNSSGQNQLTQKIPRYARKRNLEKTSQKHNQISIQTEKIGVKKIAIDSTTIPGKKGGEKIGYDGNKKILGTKINVIVASNGLPINYAQSCKQA